jgi:hypothetical protein
MFSLRATCPAFDQLLALLPEAFVGSYSRLRALVQLASQMVASACSEARQEVPPWRSRAALLSRWRRLGSYTTPVGQQPAAAGAGSRLVRAHMDGRSRPDSPQARREAALAAFPAARVALGFDASPASQPAPGALRSGEPWGLSQVQQAEPLQQADAVATFTLAMQAAVWEPAAAKTALGAAKQQQHGSTDRVCWPAGMDPPWAGQLPRVYKVWPSRPGGWVW